MNQFVYVVFIMIIFHYVYIRQEEIIESLLGKTTYGFGHEKYKIKKELEKAFE